MSLFGIGAPAVASIVGGLASDVLGGIMGENSAEEMAQMQFENQKELMRIQNQYQVENYQHRHQWEVGDLRKAGLNPILSANSAAAAPSVGLGSAGMPTPAHKYDFAKSMEALFNSALVKKQTEIKDQEIKNDTTRAEADFMRAKAESDRTESAIALNESSAKLNIKQIEMLDKNYELNKLYNEANIREIDQRIINSVMEVQAKVQYYQDLGESAKISASAQATQAAAALSNAESQRIIAEVAQANGISQRQLNDALQGKADAETKEAMERALKVNAETGILDYQLQKDKIHNPYGASGQSGLGEIFFRAGEILRNGISGGAGFLK